jgi:hypothetical protein
MNRSMLQHLLEARGADFPTVAAALADLPVDDPLRQEGEASLAAADQHRADAAARHAAAQAAKAREGQGSPLEQIADLAARIAALEGG